MDSRDPLFADALRAWEAAGLKRVLQPLTGVDFCTNDYLGLALDPSVVGATLDAVRDAGAGSRAARLLGGELPLHTALEAEAAAWLGTEAALLFASGYHANLAVLTTLCGSDDRILSDADNHASIIDGCRLSAASVQVFPHQDAEALRKALDDATHFARRWIVVESVYSVDGSLAPLEDYVRLGEEYDARLLVDEAHAAGLYGDTGAGRCTALPAARRIAARVVTGGKALGAAGALVAGDREVIELLLNRARTFVFTTASPPATVAALSAAIRVVTDDAARRDRPHRAAARLRTALREAGHETPPGSPIVFVPIGGSTAAVRVAEALQERGLEVRAVRPPTVPPGRSGLRIVCHADHDEATIDALAAALIEALPAADERKAQPTPEAKARALVVVGTDTEVGKTVVSAALMRAYQRRGLEARYWKPAQTGTESDTHVVTRLAALPEEVTVPPIVQLRLPASVDQASAAEGRTVRAVDVVGPIREALAAAANDHFVIETVGGLLVPYNDHESQADVVAALAMPVVLVARSGLGTLNHSLLTIEALRRRGISLRALVLVGKAHAENRRTLARRLGALPILEMPHFERLDVEALDAWIDANDALEAVL